MIDLAPLQSMLDDILEQQQKAGAQLERIINEMKRQGYQVEES